MACKEQQEKQMDNDGGVAPFEWLTSASSLQPILSECKGQCALHLGCGSSTLGEYLVTSLGYDQVSNVDKDGDLLQQAQERWKRVASLQDYHKLQFFQLDFCDTTTNNTFLIPQSHFDLVLDKSTLDCTLCSDDATTGLLCLAYTSLKPGGSYLLVSFHHVDMLLPLLQNLPGAEWTVSHYSIKRQVEEIQTCHKNDTTTVMDNNAKQEVELFEQQQPSTEEQCSRSSFDKQDECKEQPPSTEEEGQTGSSQSSFDPASPYYRKWVNVFRCTKTSDSTLDPELVRDHIHSTNNAWFQLTNPMLTNARQEELKRVFGENVLALKECYNNIFTEAEREHLSYEYFLQDWQAFLEMHPTTAKDEMSLETALAFLQEMQ